MEEFYLEDMAISIQGILEGYSQSISAIAEHSLIKIHRTTLLRFLNEHDEFWKEMKKRFQVLLFDKGEKTLVVDDTHLERKSKVSRVPFGTHYFDIPDQGGSRDSRVPAGVEFFCDKLHGISL